MNDTYDLKQEVISMYVSGMYHRIVSDVIPLCFCSSLFSSANTTTKYNISILRFAFFLFMLEDDIGSSGIFLSRYAGDHKIFIPKITYNPSFGFYYAGVIFGTSSFPDSQTCNPSRFVLPVGTWFATKYRPVTRCLEVFSVWHSSLHNHILAKCPASEESSIRFSFENNRFSKIIWLIGEAWRRLLFAMSKYGLSRNWTSTRLPLRPGFIAYDRTLITGDECM